MPGLRPPLAPSRETYLVVESVSDVDRYLGLIRSSAERAQAWIVHHKGDSLDLLRHMKFHPVGFHPIEDRPLNLVEQLNQTWTYAVALVAARKLLELHPDAGGFKAAPGAHMSIPLDIMSVSPGVVGAETFIAGIVSDEEARQRQRGDPDHYRRYLAVKFRDDFDGWMDRAAARSRLKSRLS